MRYELKGRPAHHALDPVTRHRCSSSILFQQQCRQRPLLYVVHALSADVTCVGGLSGPRFRPEFFLCLVFRLLEICPAPSVILCMLQQEKFKYLRVAAMLVIRLIGDAEMVREAVRVGLDDYRKVRIIGDEVEEAENLNGDEAGRRHRCRPTLAAINGSLLDVSKGLVSNKSGSWKRPRDEESSDGHGGSSGNAAIAANSGGITRLDDETEEMHGGAMEYFIWRMDEVTDHLFGIQSREAAGNSGASPVFLGIALPRLLIA